MFLKGILFLFCVNPASIVTLERSNEYTHFSQVKILGDYIYAANQHELMVYQSNGHFVKRLLRGGSGPDRIDNIHFMFRQDDAIWVSSSYWTLKIQGEEVIEKRRVAGQLCGFFDGNEYFRRIKGTRKGAFMGYSRDETGGEGEPFLPASDAYSKNNRKIDLTVIMVHPPYLFFGDGLSNDFFIRNLVSGDTTRVQPLLTVLNPYSLELHGTMPTVLKLATINQVAQKFFSSFDSVNSNGNCFWIEYKGMPYVVITWAYWKTKKIQYLYQVFDLNGKYMGFRITKFPPKDWDEAGNLLFITKDDREDEDEDFKLVRISMDEFFSKAVDGLPN